MTRWFERTACGSSRSASRRATHRRRHRSSESGHHKPDDAVALVQDEQLTIRSHCHAQVRTRGEHPPLLHVLFLDHLEERLHRPLIADENAMKALPARWQLVRIDVEDLAARVVAEDQL